MNTLARDVIVSVEPGTIDDWPAIQALRHRYFDQIGVPYVTAPDATRWVVARAGDRVIGVLGYVEQKNELWATDLYRVPGPRGTAAVFKLVWYYNDLAQKGEYLRRFVVSIANDVMQLAAHKHKIPPIAIVFGDPC